MDTTRTKVLYIAGSGRSGSTILGNVLGQIEGLFHAGELYSIWDVGLLRNTSCGCGQKLSTCSLWKEILEESFGSVLGRADVEKMLAMRRRTLRTHEVPLALYIPNEKYTKPEPYIARLEHFYRAIRQVTQCEWVVDSSKIPSYAYLLHAMSSVDLHVLHLIRDPRAVAYSWQRKAINGHQPDFTRSTLVWAGRNVVTETFRSKSRYLQLRYEDFAHRPIEAVRDVLRFMGLHKKILPFPAKDEVKLAATHTVWGNPGRHRTGVVKISADEQWKQEMSLYSKVGVSTMAWPLLLRYRYSGGLHQIAPSRKVNR